jgi:N6-L-threonylcarbamoyladenine synthase
MPPPALCTDNGAMIAWAGAERLALGLTDTMEAPPRARWLLDANATAPAVMPTRGRAIERCRRSIQSQ